MNTVAIYSTIWGLEKSPNSFDIKGALANWALYAQHISIACGDEFSRDFVEKIANENGFPVSCIKTNFDFKEDPFAYGKTENEALQNCQGDTLIQQNMDERIRINKDILFKLSDLLLNNPTIGAFFVPTIDLYGDVNKYLAPIKAKWYIHKEGYFRGPVKFGIKENGYPDYHKTSTDELIDRNGNLVPTVKLLENSSIEGLREYVNQGMPIVYHLGYLDFKERLERSLWWKSYWEKATGGDSNQHPTSIEEIAQKETQEHGLPIWDSVFLS